MKYEKFEEWMLYVPVVTSNGDDGEITDYLVYDRVVVLLQNGAAIVSHICDLEFLEEKPSEEVGAQENSQNNWEGSQIDWQVGQVVWDIELGKGVVAGVDNLNFPKFPIFVNFERGGHRSYSTEGKQGGVDSIRSLYFSEPVITAELFPPKKPFAPKLKFDDKLMVINSHGKVECYGYVEQEFEDSVAMRTGEVYEKAYYNFFELGEEIKFE